MMNIGFVGDVAFSGILSTESEKNNERFNRIVPFLSSFDLIFANLETPICSDFNFNEYKRKCHYTDNLTAIDLLKKLNIKCVSLANNHIYDCKMTGLEATIDMLDKLGIHHTGAGWLKEHIDPIVINHNGFAIGFIAYVDRSTNPKTEFFSELLINYLDLDKVIADVKRLKPKVDKIICSIHWGVDYSFYPTKQQIQMAHRLIDEGVDVIMGHHTHTMQPYERYNNGIIFYSLGGLTFGDFQRNGKMYALYRKTKKGIIVRCNIEKMSLDFCATKELIGNYVIKDSLDYQKWSNWKWIFYRLKESSWIFKFFISFNEKVIYRIYEYFFGYYQSPIKRLFQLSNIKKMKKLFK